MKIKQTEPAQLLNFLKLSVLILILTLLIGCVSPIALNRAVLAYDDAVTDTISQQLLINIVRAHHRQPIHFTGVSNIAATFTFHANAGAMPASGGLAGTSLMPIFGGGLLRVQLSALFRLREKILLNVY